MPTNPSQHGSSCGARTNRGGLTRITRVERGLVDIIAGGHLASPTKDVRRGIGTGVVCKGREREEKEGEVVRLRCGQEILPGRARERKAPRGLESPAIGLSASRYRSAGRLDRGFGDAPPPRGA